MQTETENRANKIASSQNAPRREQALLDSLIKQLTILAVVFGSPESVTAERLRVYAQELFDLSPERLAHAFSRARRELKFFPSIAELRELAGAAVADERKVQAEAAWQCANDYLREWGVERLPIYRGGKKIEAPPIPPEINYALRRIGGLRGLNQITEESRPFIFRDFCESYLLAPTADAFGYLPAPLSDRPALTGETENRGELVSFTDIAKQLTDVARAKEMPEQNPRRAEYELRACHVPMIPSVQLTQEQIEARREGERAEIESYKAQRNSRS